MDASIVETALGLQQVEQVPLVYEKVRILRYLIKQNATHSIRRYSTLSQLLTTRPMRHVDIRRHVPAQCVQKDPTIKDDLELLELFSDFEWKGLDFKKKCRHDDIIYLSSMGTLVLWRGECLLDACVERYRSLQLSPLNDDGIGAFISSHEDFFEEAIEKLRTLYLDSIRSAEDELMYMRDAFRLTVGTQRRLGYHPCSIRRDAM